MTTSDTNNVMRLQKFLARAGVASRRASEQLIVDGRVKINGKVETQLGVKVNPRLDVVEFDDKKIVLNENFYYIVLNKPTGVLSTMDDPQGRKTVASLIPTEKFPGIFPVGRLDKNTTGVLLFLSDGELGSKLLHPSSGVKKTYVAIVGGRPSKSGLKQIKRGIELNDGRCAPADVEVIGRDKKANTTTVKLTIHEGRKRQVRRMFAKIGNKVVHLDRVSFAGVKAAGLERGAWRELNQNEIDMLNQYK